MLDGRHAQVRVAKRAARSNRNEYMIKSAWHRLLLHICIDYDKKWERGGCCAGKEQRCRVNRPFKAAAGGEVLHALQRTFQREGIY